MEERFSPNAIPVRSVARSIAQASLILWKQPRRTTVKESERQTVTLMTCLSHNSMIRLEKKRHFSAQVVFFLTTTLGLGLGNPIPATADNVETEETEQAQAPPDFLFNSPTFSLGVRGQWFSARANSDLYDFVSQTLTLEREDFNAPGIALDVSAALHPRLEARLGMDFTRSFSKSEYREFIGADGLPIEQETSLKQVDLTASVLFAIVPRGRAIGQYAWIPNRIFPYVGGGGGFMWYELQQFGDFVEADFSISSLLLRSRGWTPSAHLFSGLDARITRRLYLTAEARYIWASAELTRGFMGFEPLDLTGLRITAGLRLLF